MKTIILVAIPIGLLLALTCGSPKSPPAPPKQSANMLHILIKTSETVPIRLDEPTAPGYNWYYSVSEDWVISMIEPYDTPAKSGGEEERNTAHVPGKKVFEVTGLKPGKVMIRFYQMNPPKANALNGVETFYEVEVKTF